MQLQSTYKRVCLCYTDLKPLRAFNQGGLGAKVWWRYAPIAHSELFCRVHCDAMTLKAATSVAVTGRIKLGLSS